MIEVTVISAFVGGLLTFLAPCTLPLIPAYIGFITGGKAANRKVLLVRSGAFVLGFSVIFMLFGLASGVFGQFLVLHRLLISQVGGAIIIIFALSMLGFIKVPRFDFLPRKLPGFIIQGTIGGSFMLGLLFALGWSPCLGPILGTILILAASSGSALTGAALLAVYAIGLAIPFLMVALIFGATFNYIERSKHVLGVLNTLSGILLFGIGIMMLIGQFGALNSIFIGLFGDIGINALIEYM
jgi:cytochrome c-type biogenesis protein